ncbi:hypothetical protein ACFL0Q_03155 [Thermodesulfobacteriota bacterium]
MAEATKDFRPRNNVIFDWEVEYRGYGRLEDYESEGPIDFHVMVQIIEALVKVKEPKTSKKKLTPGYILVVTLDVKFNDKKTESLIVYEESFLVEDLNKAFDVFQRELMNIHGWIIVAESRNRFIPPKKDIFECIFCGWVTDLWKDDILCQGCGKRFWSEKAWGKK